MKRKTVPYIVTLVSLVSCLIVNEMNIYHMRADGVRLRDNEMVITADDASYLRPAINLSTVGELKGSWSGNGAFLVHSTGYSLFIAFIGEVFGFDNLYRVLKIVQLLLFGMSVLLMYKVALYFLKSDFWTTLVVMFYGFTGIACGFVYYTLTEGLTPFLVLLYIYSLIKSHEKPHSKGKVLFYVATAVAFAILFITRPVLGVLGLSMPLLLWIDYWNKISHFVLMLFLVGFFASSLMIGLQIRNWMKTNEIVGLHPIYYPENSMSCFRPTHKAMWNFCKSWGEVGADFHHYMVPFWEQTILGDTSAVPVRRFVASLPEDVQTYFGVERLIGVMTKYQNSIEYQRDYYHNQIPMPKTIPACEQEVINELEIITSEFRSHFWFRYHILAPLDVFSEMAFHSNLSLYIFQKTYRGAILMETLRVLTFAVHSIAFIWVFLAVFTKSPFLFRATVVFPTAIYLFYLIYFQRGIEERYTLPILSLALINGGYWIKYLYLKVQTLVR